jgi:hypothetical protein
MAEKPMPRLQQFSDFASYNAAVAINDEEAVAGVLQHIELEVGVPAFLTATPSYYACPENSELLLGWCNSRGVPLTLWNLTLAFRDLSEDEQLKSAPPAVAPVTDKSRGVTLVRQDALLEYQAPRTEQAELSKLADDPNLSDHARKARDRRLAILAGQQRRELSTLPAHHGQRVVI